MTSSTVPTSSTAGPQKNEAFPQLTAVQLHRLEPHGHRRKLAQGEVVGEPGQPVTKIFVVVSGQLDASPRKRIWASKHLPSAFPPGMLTGSARFRPAAGFFDGSPG